MDLLLTGGTVLDGLGSPGAVRDVAVVGGRVLLDPRPDALDRGVERRHVSGLVVCPGFVDVHTHSDLTLLSDPVGHSKLRQGVTTEVVGNCGLGLAPLLPDEESAVPAPAVREAVGYLDLDPAVRVTWSSFEEYLTTLGTAGTALNVAAFVPHLPLHAGVVGLDETKASGDQISRIAGLADEALDAGAVGVSTGLAYAPLCWAEEDELRALGSVVARHDRLFAWHVRDHADDLLASVRQALRVARATGCRTQISHLAAVGRRNWGSVEHALAEVDAARHEGLDVGVDIYPYLAGSCPLSQLLPESAQRGGEAAFARLRQPETRDAVRAAWAEAPFQWSDIVVTALAAGHTAPPGLLGRDIAGLATSTSVAPDDLALDLLAEHGSAVLVVAHGRSADDLAAVLAHPAAVVASDGQAVDPAGPTGTGRPHPRSFGCFPRYLSRYAHDLPDGVRRCTSAPADRVGLGDRGRLVEGAPADLVVLSPGTLADTATFEDPQQHPTGITMVLVGGRVVVDDGVVTTERPGTVLRPADTDHPTRRPAS